MTYRFPVVVGDRVAVAPHTDAWVEGLRFGTVTKINTARGSITSYKAQRYTVEFDGRYVRRFFADDLLGAINAVPGKTG